MTLMAKAFPEDDEIERDLRGYDWKRTHQQHQLGQELSDPYQEFCSHSHHIAPIETHVAPKDSLEHITATVGNFLQTRFVDPGTGHMVQSIEAALSAAQRRRSPSARIMGWIGDSSAASQLVAERLDSLAAMEEHRLLDKIARLGDRDPGLALAVLRRLRRLGMLV